MPSTTYAVADGIATITLDDGKVNALSPATSAEIEERLAQAESDDAIVVLTGREQVFSAGFDLRVPPEEWPAMVAAGARLAARMLAHPAPVVAACNGSAVAMGAFLLLAADVRIGVQGGHRIGLNEVAIGLTLPWFGVELAHHRLTAPYADRCTVTGAILDPEEALRAGFLDRLVAPDALAGAAAAAAADLAKIDRAAHARRPRRGGCGRSREDRPRRPRGDEAPHPQGRDRARPGGCGAPRRRRVVSYSRAYSCAARESNSYASNGSSPTTQASCPGSMT